jgi:hypothetical protein
VAGGAHAQTRAGPSLPTLVPAVIPSAVDPPTGERAVARGATLVHGQPVTAQPGASGDGLLGSPRVDGRRDDSSLLDHPGVGAPPPEAWVPVKLHVHSRHYHLDPRQPPGARAERSGSER